MVEVFVAAAQVETRGLSNRIHAGPCVPPGQVTKREFDSKAQWHDAQSQLQ